MKSILGKYFPFGNFNPYFKKDITTLGLFSKLYKKTERTQIPGVYRILCGNCDQSYVGQTGRALFSRIKEHQYYVRTNRSSALTVHSNKGHCMNLSNGRIVYPENNPIKRLIAEAIIIKNSEIIPDNKPSFNLNVFDN